MNREKSRNRKESNGYTFLGFPKFLNEKTDSSLKLFYQGTYILLDFTVQIKLK